MIATTINQSKQLLDAGIAENTADMHWHYPLKENKASGYVVAKKPDLYFGPRCWIYYNDAPAWSLSALIQLCPEHIPYRIIRARGKDIDGIFEDIVNYLCKKN